MLIGTPGERAMRRVDRAVSCSMLIQAAKPHFFNIGRRRGQSTSALREPHEKSRRNARQICQKFCPLNTDVDAPRFFRSPSSSHRILPSRWRGSDARADERGGENENASGGDHRSWQSFWRDRFLSMRQGGGDQADYRLRGLHH